MSLLSRHQRSRTLGASPQDRVSAQSHASVASEPSRYSRWGRLFRRHRTTRTRSSAAGEAPVSLLTLSSPSHSRPPQLRRVSKRSSLHSLRAILQNTRAPDLPEESPRRPVRQDYSAYHSQTPPPPPPGPGSTPNVWNPTGPLPSLRHRGQPITRAYMTSGDILEAQSNDANVDSTPRQHTENTEAQQRTAHARSITPTPSSTLFGPVTDPYSEAVADWNIGIHGKQSTPSGASSVATHQGRKRLPEAGKRHSLSHKPDISNLRESSAEGHRAETSTADMGFFHRRSHDKERRSHDKERKLSSAHGEKTLPETSNGDVSHKRNKSEQASRPQEGRSSQPGPVAAAEQPPRTGASRSNLPREGAAQQQQANTRPQDSEIHSELGRERGYLVRDAKKPVDLTGIVDLTHTEDTDVTVTHAPLVTHETVHVQSREIRQEHITREIHNHHIYHRVLPVLDFEVLPARHFIPAANGGLTEITEDQIPGGSMTQDVQRVIADAISNMMPRVQHPVAPRQFTARTFEGKEYDYKEWVGDDGVKRTEQWWVHPPTLETDITWVDSSWEGQARDFHFHSEQDGFRDRALDNSSHGAIPIREGSLRKPAKHRFPPPRGASLGKTSAAGAAGPAGPTVLPIRMAHGDGKVSSQHPGVGVAL